jgi:capsule polysaccharide modification protein KpsS
MRRQSIGFSARKRRWLAQFVGHHVDAYAQGDLLSDQDQLFVWGDQEVPPQARLARLVRVEDGFLRSAGLGAALSEPLSWGFDGGGLHHDARQTSELESRLQQAQVDPALLARARRLREAIVDAGVTKYNVGRTAFAGWAPHAVGQRRRVLVVGQVAGDAALRSIDTPVCSNLQLLAQVRAMHPDAFIAYKRHPDVVHGLRRGDDEQAGQWADVVLEHEALQALLGHVDEVHVMSSLAGFEALLRGQTVVCHANPFYAGWGLTHDRHPVGRRTRRRTLDELVAIALILWPRYRLPGAGQACEAEDVVALLARRVPPSRLSRAHGAVAMAAGRLMRRLGWADALPPQHAHGPVIPAVADASWSGQDWRGRHVLLLQGPVGPFFRRLARQLRAAGAGAVHKLNFNGGDSLFFPSGQSYRGPMAGIPDAVKNVADARGVTDVVLFGDCRPVHAGLPALCDAMGLRLWVFEEGYFRPDYITCEAGGVNGHSRIRVSPEPYRAAATGQPPAHHQAVPWAYWAMATWACLYYLASAMLAWRHPGYRHHRSLAVGSETWHWCVGLWRKLDYRRQQRGVQQHLTSALQGRYFLVPLQVHNDAQVTHHSPFDDVWHFIDRVVGSFAVNASADHVLVIKHHPMDRAYRDYRLLIEHLRQRHGLGTRLWYVHDLHTPTLLAHAAGTVVINSTVGLASVHQSVPTKVMGKAFYDFEGLTCQDCLDDFWTTAHGFRVDEALYHAFRGWVVRHTQINDNFYAPMRPARNPPLR